MFPKVQNPAIVVSSLTRSRTSSRCFPSPPTCVSPQTSEDSTRVCFRDKVGDGSDTLFFFFKSHHPSIHWQSLTYKMKLLANFDGMSPFCEIPYTFTLIALYSSRGFRSFIQYHSRERASWFCILVANLCFAFSNKQTETWNSTKWLVRLYLFSESWEKREYI